jgi:hypothetical protein
MIIKLTPMEVDFLIRKIDEILELKRRNKKSNKPLGFGKKV